MYSMNNLNLEISLEKAHSLYTDNNLLIIDVRTKRMGNSWYYSWLYFNKHA